MNIKKSTLRRETLPEKFGKINPFRLKIYDHPGRIFTFEDQDRDLNTIRDILGKSTQLYCEIGSGSGLHLIKRAQHSPTSTFFGVELRYKRSVRTAEKAESLNIENLFLLHMDAQYLGEVLPRESIDGIYINFPDPWEKKKGRKHRLLSELFFRKILPLLKEGSFVSVKTDHRACFHEFLNEVKRVAEFEIESQSEDLYRSEYVENNVQTEFEKLFLSQGIQINYVELRKNKNVSSSNETS